MNIKIKGSKKTTFLYAGDRWATGNTLWESRYIWLPATIDDQSSALTVHWHDVYAIDVKTGELTFPRGRSYEAEDGVVTDNAMAVNSESHSFPRRYHDPDGLWGDNRGGNNITLARNAVL
ncbi:hypothetical protein BDV98DRAFT_582760 [Pterulicium gracile]|uniref:Uncharacterized protein n=1 Tax=Pterulicium gracile TaxID=1884261 RepID=A0A5C3QNE3_9AGAR|nr:hypothetical protein BDV98DRAFT_582760 [Pterula gracilis]